MKIDTVEMIPMTKESPFEEKAVLETSGIPAHDGFTTDAKEWVEACARRAAIMPSALGVPGRFGRNICVETTQWIAGNMKCDGFMVAPVATVEDEGTVKILEARSRKVTDFKEFVDHINNSDERFYPYTVEFMPNIPVAYNVDGRTFEPIAKPYPEVSTSYGAWVIRYATLPNSSGV